MVGDDSTWRADCEATRARDSLDASSLELAPLGRARAKARAQSHSRATQRRLGRRQQRLSRMSRVRSCSGG